MRVAVRIFLKDALELSQSRGLLAIALLAPVLLMLLIGNLNVREPTLRLAIVAGEAGEDDQKQLRSMLEERSNVLTPLDWPAQTTDLLSRSVRERVDIVAVWEGEWHFYTPRTQPYRLQLANAAVQDLTLSLERDARLEEQNGTGADMPVPLLRAATSNRLNTYFPPISQVDRSIVPSYVALIAVFLPFLLVSGALAREREAGILETLILAARGNWFLITAGKLVLPVLAGMTSIVLLLLVARTAYGFGFKPGILPALGVQLLAALDSALLGFAISTLIRSPIQAYLTSAVYLVGLILVTGMIYPIAQAAAPVVVVSYAFPLTFSGPLLEAWMTQGATAILSGPELLGLLGQFVVFAIVCAIALRYGERSLY